MECKVCCKKIGQREKFKLNFMNASYKNGGNENDEIERYP